MGNRVHQEERGRRKEERGKRKEEGGKRKVNSFTPYGIRLSLGKAWL
jgi:hypothetical protein